MRTFGIVWSGQVVSMLGTSMTRFALAIWLWEQTGEATALVLVGIFSSIPSLFVSPVAGALVDRWNRQRVMIVADLIAGMGTTAIFILFAAGGLAPWHLYVVAFVAGLVGTFQYLAYSAALTLMIPPKHYTRAQGLIGLGRYASSVGAPFLGGLLLSAAGLEAVLVVDVLSFLFGVGTLLLVRIPQPEVSADHVPQTLWRDSIMGFGYIARRPGLLGLMLIILVFVTTESLAYPLITPMILARSGDEVILGTVLAVQGIGGVLGGIIMTAWGGMKKRVYGVFIGLILTGLLGDALMGAGRSLPVWLVAAVSLEIFIPLLFGSYVAIWQTQVEPGMQGRVFAARDLIVTLGEPAAMLIAGVASDRVLEPAMMPGGALADSFGWLVGTGPGAGMGLLMVLGGLLAATAGVIGWLARPVREVEGTPQP